MTRTLSTNLNRVKKTKLTADLALPSWITNHVFNKKIRIQQKESE